MAEEFLHRGYQIVSGGTDNHLLLVNLVNRDFTGKAAEESLGRANITVNKNAVPNDPRSPFITSGIRIGTAAITTRGFQIPESRVITSYMCDILDDIDHEETAIDVRSKVLDLCQRFPVYDPELYQLA